MDIRLLPRLIPVEGYQIRGIGRGIVGKNRRSSQRHFFSMFLTSFIFAIIISFPLEKHFLKVYTVYLCGEVPTCFSPLGVNSSHIYAHALASLSAPLKTSKGGRHVLMRQPLVPPGCLSGKFFPFSLWKYGSWTMKQDSIQDSMPVPTCFSEDTVLSDWQIPTRSWWVLLLELYSEIPNLLHVLPLGRCRSF